LIEDRAWPFAVHNHAGVAAHRQSSRGGTEQSDPDSEDLTAGWLDPVARYNIMLKGYLLQAGALYDMLYRDGKYDRDGRSCPLDGRNRASRV
jgi:hypothetical protein